MHQKFKVLITFLVAVFLIAGLYLFTNWFSLITGYFAGESEVEKLAFCLSSQGAEFYGTTFCPDCERQAKLFGQHFQSINYIECGEDRQLCPNIQSLPAWYINKKIHYGLKTINELKEISGCS